MTIALGLVVALLQALAAAGQPPRGTIVEHVSCPSDPSRVLTRLTGDDVPLVDELRSRLNLESLSKAAHGRGIRRGLRHTLTGARAHSAIDNRTRSAREARRAS